ncbi:hypothetical protein KGM_207244 [Danaus plexippus plexippus]|uniref:Uncharacterized protein n=1 Tax=Danaus plexippus plexippus TaxID=278856 RepID=A0A212ERX4_DANPL|nr:hypothetical protein KGM_207244 [Danaus plexippus plexippus]
MGHVFPLTRSADPSPISDRTLLQFNKSGQRHMAHVKVAL